MLNSYVSCAVEMFHISAPVTISVSKAQIQFLEGKFLVGHEYGFSLYMQIGLIMDLELLTAFNLSFLLYQ